MTHGNDAGVTCGCDQRHDVAVGDVVHFQPEFDKDDGMNREIRGEERESNISRQRLPAKNEGPESEDAADIIKGLNKFENEGAQRALELLLQIARRSKVGGKQRRE